MPLYTNQPSNPQDQQQQQAQNPNAPIMPEGRRARGTGFTNIGKMLGANVGPQGQTAGSQMGQNIGAGISQKAGKVKQDVNAAYNQFQDEYNKQQQAAFGTTGSIGAVQGLAPGAAGSLTEQQAIDLGKALKEANYGGPMELEQGGQLANRISGLQNLGRFATSGAAGQGMLLASQAGKRGYSRGQGYLDQFLLAQDPTAQREIQQAAATGLTTGQQAIGKITGAESQAQTLKNAIDAEKANVTKDLIGNIDVLKTEGGAQAKSFLSDANRLKQILIDTSEKGYITTPTGEKVFDPNQLAKDQELIKNMSNYGINPDVDVYAGSDSGSTDALDAYIKSLAGQGATEYTGQTKYTPDQQKALKNLALITGQTDLAKTTERAFESPFSVASKDISGGEFQKGQEKRIKELQDQTGITDQNEVNKLVNDINTTIGNKDKDTNAFFSDAQKILGTDAYIKILNDTIKQTGVNKPFGATQAYNRGITKNNLEAALKTKLDPLQKLNTIYSSKTNLKDYINKKFGIPSGNQGQ